MGGEPSWTSWPPGGVVYLRSGVEFNRVRIVRYSYRTFYRTLCLGKVVQVGKVRQVEAGEAGGVRWRGGARFESIALLAGRAGVS